jgi:hypothetical protein
MVSRALRYQRCTVRAMDACTSVGGADCRIVIVRTCCCGQKPVCAGTGYVAVETHSSRTPQRQQQLQHRHDDASPSSAGRCVVAAASTEPSPAQRRGSCSSQRRQRCIQARGQRHPHAGTHDARTETRQETRAPGQRHLRRRGARPGSHLHGDAGRPLQTRRTPRKGDRGARARSSKVTNDNDGMQPRVTDLYRRVHSCRMLAHGGARRRGQDGLGPRRRSAATHRRLVTRTAIDRCAHWGRHEAERGSGRRKARPELRHDVVEAGHQSRHVRPPHSEQRRDGEPCEATRSA